MLLCIAIKNINIEYLTKVQILYDLLNIIFNEWLFSLQILRAADENSEEPPGNIIIITGSEDNLIVVMFNNAFCIKDISIPDNIDELTSNLPCLEVVRIPMSEELKSEEFYGKLIETIEKICLFKVEDRLTEMVRFKKKLLSKTIKSKSSIY